MMLALAVSALLAQVGVRAPAGPRQPEGWEVSLGAGAFVTPRYQGSSSLRVLPLPVIDVKYADRLFISVLGGVGVNVIALPALHLGVAFAPNFGRADGSDARLSGWGHIDPGVIGRLFAETRLGPLRAATSIQHELGTSSGTLADLGLSSMLPLDRHFILTGGALVTWADGQYMREYFGIAESQLAAARADNVATALFTPGAGFRDVALSLGMIVPLDEKWSLTAFFRGTRLLGGAANSPVVQQKTQLATGTMLSIHWR
jgi:outer membrane protein